MSSDWIPSSELVNTFTKWNGRKVLSEIHKNLDYITGKSFEAGLDQVLTAAARDNNMPVLQALLQPSILHYKTIDHLHVYKIETEKKHPELVHSMYAFQSSFSWMKYQTFWTPDDADKWFVPCIELQGTLLHIAAQAGNIKIVQFLHQQGANINAVNCCGRTTLMAGIHHVDVATYLILNGCNVNLQDRWGQTAIMLTTWKAKTCKSLLKPLLNAGADPKLVDKYGKTFVHYACELTLDGDCLPALIENNLFQDIEYVSSTGSMLYAGRPLFFNHGFSTLRKAKQFKEDPLLLLFIQKCELLTITKPEDFRKCLPSITKLLTGFKSPPYECAPPNSLYGNRKEVSSLSEFDALVSSSNDLYTEFIYQRLIMSERLSGEESLETISLVNDLRVLCLLEFDGMLFKISNDTTDIRSLIADLTFQWLKRASNYFEKFLGTKSVLESLLHFYLPIVESSDISAYKHLLPELLTVYAKLTRHLSHADVHAHRYSHTPKCDVAAVQYGTCYMDIMNTRFCPSAAYNICLCISKVMAGEFHLSEDIIQDMVSSCAIHPYSPTFDTGQVLVQPSNILESAVSSYESFDDECRKLCSKLVEMSPVDLVNELIPDEGTMLHLAVEKDWPDLVDFLLANGAHPDAVDAHGEPPSSKASGSSTIRYKLLGPRKLQCIASQAVVDANIPYQSIDLPERIMKIISFHDKRRFTDYIQHS